LDPEDFHLADSHNNLAVVLLDQGNYAGAEPLVRRSLFITQKRLGPTLFLYPDRQAKVLAAGKKYTSQWATRVEIQMRLTGLLLKASGFFRLPQTSTS
jgi:Tetratricopeptide repeat